MDIPQRDFHYPRGTFADEVSSHLITLTFKALNERHKRHLRNREVAPPFQRERDIKIIERWMTFVSRELYEELYDSEEPNAVHRRLKDRLPRGKFEDGMRSRAEWVFKRWNPRLVEARVEGGRKGGSHGWKDGTMKGRRPRFTHGHIRAYLTLPSKIRKATVLAETGMSQSTYYRLMADAPAAEARIAARAAEDRIAARATEWHSPYPDAIDRLLNGE